MLSERASAYLQIFCTLLLNVILYSFSFYIVLKALALIPDSHADLRMYLRIVILTGAYGGLLRSLFARADTFELTTFVTSKAPCFRAGTFADVLIGIGASVAVFFVFANSLKLDSTTGSIFMVISLGIIAGFASRNLLVMLQHKLEQRVGEAEKEAKTAKAEAEDAKRLTTAKSYYAIAESLMINYEAGIVPDARKQFVITQAAKQLEEALKTEPTYAKAMVAMGYVKKRLADFVQDLAGKKTLLKQAIQHCKDALRVDGNLASAYFNIACYQSLLWEESPNAIIPNLENAAKLDPRYLKELEDPDLANLRETDEFKVFYERHGIQPP